MIFTLNLADSRLDKQRFVTLLRKQKLVRNSKTVTKEWKHSQQKESNGLLTSGRDITKVPIRVKTLNRIKGAPYCLASISAASLAPISPSGGLSGGSFLPTRLEIEPTYCCSWSSYEGPMTGLRHNRSSDNIATLLIKRRMRLWRNLTLHAHQRSLNWEIWLSLNLIRMIVLFYCDKHIYNHFYNLVWNVVTCVVI